MLDIKYFPAGFDIYASGIRDAYIPVSAVEKLQSNLLLNLFYILGEGWLGDVQGCGGFGEGAFAGEGEDVLELFNIHYSLQECHRIIEHSIPFDFCNRPDKIH